MNTRNVLCAIGVAASAMLLAVPGSAAEKAAPAKKTTETAKRTAWAPETLSGQIVSVDAGKNLVIMKDASGVPFDVMVTPATKILSASDQKLKLSDLVSDTNRNVSIRIVPERKGDVARKIDLSSRG